MLVASSVIDSDEVLLAIRQSSDLLQERALEGKVFRGCFNHHIHVVQIDVMSRGADTLQRVGGLLAGESPFAHLPVQILLHYVQASLECLFADIDEQ